MQWQNANTAFDASATSGPLIPVCEILGSFSYALDMTEGQPPGHSLRAAFIAVSMARAMGLSDADCLTVHYATVMKDLGCSSNAARIAALYLADDRQFKQDYKLVDGRIANVFAFVFSSTGRDAPLGRRVSAVANILKNGVEISRQLIQTRCVRGADIARQLRLGEDVADAILALDEHWDGSGKPTGMRGHAIPLAARLALLAQVADVWYMADGAEAARAEIAKQSGRWFDPALAQCFLSVTGDFGFWAKLTDPFLEARLNAMNDAHMTAFADEGYLSDITDAFGAVIDAKSPYTAGHSNRVGHIAATLAGAVGMDEAHRRHLSRAAMLHDVGKLGVSNTILDKPGKLDDKEWAIMRDHAARTKEILGRIGVFSDMALIAASHHERLDGRGYPHGLDASNLAMETRIISVADIFDALTADRPYRGAMPLEAAMGIIDKESGGALDPDLVGLLKQAVENGAIKPSNEI